MEQIVIIGAGPAGLTAAYELLSAGTPADVTILEADAVIGGISRTVKCDGRRMDIGGHRFFSKDQRVLDWWLARLPLQGAPALDDRLTGRQKDLAAGGPDPESEDRVMLLRDRVSRIYTLSRFFDYPVTLKPETLRNLGLRRTLSAGVSYLAAAVHKRPEHSLEDFYINRFGRTLYRMFFENYTEKVWGRHPSLLSADWGAQRVKGLSIRAVFADVLRKSFGGAKAKATETSLIEQYWYPKLGPGQLWETVADEIRQMGGQIRLLSRVTGVQFTDGRIASVRFESQADNGRTAIEQLPASRVISTMPLKDLIPAINGLAVPADISRIAAGLPYRDFLTVGLLVRQLQLQNRTPRRTLGNIVPDCWIYVQEPDVKIGRIQIFNNWSPYLLPDPEHQVWLGLEYFCNEGDDLWLLSEADMVRLAVDELVQMGIIRAADVLDAHLEHVPKAYPAYFDTYSEIGRLTEWLSAIPDLYCIGRNGQHRYNNMDHSMVTAFEAVANIRSGRTDQQNIWSVNTEQAYHESSSEQS